MTGRARISSGFLVRLFQLSLECIVVVLIPVSVSAQLPAVNDVADQVKMVGFAGVEEIKKKPGLAAACAEVHVGQPD